MKRRLRLRFALLSAFAIAFAQIAVAAQTWPLVPPPHQHAAAAQPANASEAPEHCPGYSVGADSVPVAPQAPLPSANFCEVHCQDAAQPDALVVAVAAPLPERGLSVPVAEGAVVRDADTASVVVKCTSPPARLVFARFLI